VTLTQGGRLWGNCPFRERSRRQEFLHALVVIDPFKPPLAPPPLPTVRALNAVTHFAQGGFDDLCVTAH
jgi:hypothetical protein